MVNPLVLKVGLGGTIATGAGATGIVYREQIKTFITKKISSKADKVQPSSLSDETKEKNINSEKSSENPVANDEQNDSNAGQASDTVVAGTISSDSNDDQTTVENQKTSETQFTYVIVKKADIEGETITKDLYDLTTSTKNYKCSMSSTSDDNCSIFSITEPVSNKLNNLQEIKDSQTHLTKEKMSKDSFFKLIVKNEFLTNVTWDTPQIIDIVSKDETKADNTNKKYGSFTFEYKVSDSAIEGTTSLIVGKITAKNVNNDLSNDTTFKCVLTGENEKRDCSLFKIKNNQSEIKEIDLTELTPNTKTAADYKEGNYFVIDLKRTFTKIKISELKNKSVIVVSSENDDVEIATFEFQAALSRTDSDFSESNLSKIIFV